MAKEYIILQSTKTLNLTGNNLDHGVIIYESVAEIKIKHGMIKK